MKKMIGLMLVGGALLAMPSTSSLYAGGLGDMMQKMIGGGFSDADGDGLNDRDADGDGIPNGQDPDYVRPQDGSGAGSGDGTGVCDGTGPKGAGANR